jgi:hypothetical protein
MRQNVRTLRSRQLGAKLREQPRMMLGAIELHQQAGHLGSKQRCPQSLSKPTRKRQRADIVAAMAVQHRFTACKQRCKKDRHAIAAMFAGDHPLHVSLVARHLVAYRPEGVP